MTSVTSHIQLYLEEQRTVVVDAELDGADGHDVRLEIELELTQLQFPREVRQLTLVDRSAQLVGNEPEHTNTV